MATPTKAVSVRIEGAPELLAALRLAGVQAGQAAAAALTEEGERIMAEAKAQTPVDTGALRASGHVQAPVRSGDTVAVTLGFGGAASPYAVYVHEDLTARHAPGTGAKFLERPVLAAAARMPERLAAAIRRRWGG